MKTLFEMRTYVSEQIEDDSTGTIAVIDSWINKALKNLCDKYVWGGYSKNKTITPNATTGAFYVPPSFGGVIQLVPSDDSFGQFSYLSVPARRGNRIAEPHYMEGISRAAATAVDTAGTVTNGSAAVTSTSSIFASSDVGEALLIGNSGYEYEIATYIGATSITLTSAYRGASAAATARITLEPPGVRQFIVYDEADDVYTSSVILSYKVIPQILYNAWDRPMIDADDAIMYGALIEALRNEKYSIDAERLARDYADAVGNARQSEIRPPRKRMPKGLLTPLPAFSFHTNRDALTDRER